MKFHLNFFILYLILIILVKFSNQNLQFDFSSTQQIILQAINQGLFSGAVIGIASNNQTYYKKAYGTIHSKRGIFAPLMSIDYKFDINWLTQVIGTNSLLMQLHDQKKLNISKKISAILSNFDNNGKHNITIENILQHNSGLPQKYIGLFPGSPQMLLKFIQQMKLDYTPETKFSYSQLGYIVLGHYIQKQKNQTLIKAMSNILLYSGLRDTGFIPTSPRYQIVPGGFNKGICQGIPYNKYANFLNFNSGNSGLFSTIDNMIHYMQLMLNKGKMPNSIRVFSEEVVNLFTTPTAQKKYHNTFAKGWDTLSEKCPCGNKFSLHSFGLSDTSGSYIWADKDKNVTILLLTNGNFPISNGNHNQFQIELSDSIMSALGY